jgi:hypothetical protein
MYLFCRPRGLIEWGALMGVLAYGLYNILYNRYTIKFPLNLYVHLMYKILL